MNCRLNAPLFETDICLSQFSTFGIGGPALYFAEAKTIEEMQSLLSFCKENQIPTLILGKGSNCLFDDRGFNGAVILNKINFCHFDWPIVHVGAGYSFSLLGTQTARQGWAGLEFASGIPGSVGGAVFMNAGANGSDTSQLIKEVTYIDASGNLETIQRSDLVFSYRTSSFQERKGAIVAAKFELTPSDVARKRQLDLIEYRTRTQPYGEKSAGCVFRNAHETPAGALIEKCELKGKKLGGAEVSTLHANFIVNSGGASAKDVLGLASMIKEEVKEKTGIDLELEIRCIPYNV